MWIFDMYHEDADSDDEPEYLGTIIAETAISALRKASDCWGYLEHDMIYKDQRPYPQPKTIEYSGNGHIGWFTPGNDPGGK